MATNGTLELIEAVTVPAGGQGAIDFINIPQTYDDLQIIYSLRDTLSASFDNILLTVNGSTTSLSEKLLYANGTSTFSATSGARTSNVQYFYATGSTATGDTFSNGSIYIQNYRSSGNKTFMIDGSTENNAVESIVSLNAGMWANSAAINRVTLTANTGQTFAQHSTAYLYGITRNPAGTKATGGMVYSDQNYWYHIFTSSGTFTPNQSLTCDVLVVAGGGGGGRRHAGGGGAGGVSWQSGRSITSGAKTVTIGAGGAGSPVSTSNGGPGSTGGNTIFDTITSNGGGGGGGFGTAALSGGSGGGGNIGSPPGVTGPGGTATQGNTGGATGYGNAGGTGIESGGYFGGGGGGAGATGQAGNSTNGGGDGGNGISSNTIPALLDIYNVSLYGQLSSGVAYIAGGGGGSRFASTPTIESSGGLGGGGTGVNPLSYEHEFINGVFGTGGGGGARGVGDLNNGLNGGNGGSGIVVIRYAK